MTDKFLPPVVAAIARTVAKVAVVVATTSAAASVASIQISNATTTSAVQTMTVFEILPIATAESTAVGSSAAAVKVVQVRRRNTSRQRGGCRPGDDGPFANRYIGCCYHVGILVAMNAIGDYR